MPKTYFFCRIFLASSLSFLLGMPVLMATHNRAGEISIEQVGDCAESLTVKAIVVTYSKTSSIQADRDSVDVCWGDGTCIRVSRTNGPGNPPKGDPLENDIKKNIYIAFHTYPSRGTYVISMNDPNRNGGILNVNFPNSEQIRFHIQTTYTFPNPQFQGCNSTPVLLQPPVDVGCVGKRFTHNPNAFDIDRDSLSYHFTIPFQNAGIIVPNYIFPNMISPGPLNRLTINERTGDIVWDAPQRAGEYNLAIFIIEYRNGVPLDTIVRDMQIRIEECDNKPPVIETSVEEVCVVAGQLLEIEVRATAPIEETNQKVRLTALGGPFEVLTNPATFELNDNIFRDDPVVKTFRWQTDCNHISDQYYSVVFKATDNFFGDTSGLATLKTIRIKVVGPPPEDVKVLTGTGFAEVNWLLPYDCEVVATNLFRGFTVWRREGSNVFPIDTCETGLEGRGYTNLTISPVQEIKDGRYFYTDNDVEPGRTYCYRILAEFAKQTTSGNIYNIIESLPSAEICVQLSREVPLLTNVDVLNTSASDGQMQVCWSKPSAADLDTLLNPGPYRYEVLRAIGITTEESAFQPIGVDFVSPSFAAANDTCFVDTGLNTAGTAYSYKIRFYTGISNGPLGTTNAASSVLLNVNPANQSNNLAWQENTPWDNYQYIVLRKNSTGGFDTLATVVQPSFVDQNLTNGQQYCYKIESIGTYGVEGIVNPIYNTSQEACGTPFDNVPPCPPVLDVKNICDEGISCTGEDQLFNTLLWTNPALDCPNEADVDGYNIYFAPMEGASFSLIARLDGSFKLDYEHKPDLGIAGCYAVTAIDTAGNESAFSNTVCVDNCPSYSLPNTFTPNGDGQNEVFKPYPFCFIDQVDFKVFNRWGQLVFETKDPALNWNGENLNGQELPEGVYYYTCRVFERRVTGVVQFPEVLSGYIELIRGR